MAVFCIIIILLSFCGCTGVMIPETPKQLVVEGWIEDGGSPVVIVTTSVPVSTEKQNLNQTLESAIVRWATVSVSDGEKEVFLTGKWDDDYKPFYVYTTSRIRGEAGKTYTLKVSYGNTTVEAQTTIPSPVRLDYIRPEKISDGRYCLKAGLTDNPETKDYYKFFTKVVGEDSSYVPSFMGLIDDDILTDGSDILVFNKFTSSFGSSEEQTCFFAGDFVLIRFCTMDEVSYRYWEDYDDVAFLSLNPFFPVSKKIRSNIEGGLGYWAGYGSTYYYVELPK